MYFFRRQATTPIAMPERFYNTEQGTPPSRSHHVRRVLKLLFRSPIFNDQYEKWLMSGD
jgi:hypothetical protein